MDLPQIKSSVLRAISPLKAAGPETQADNDFLFTAKRAVTSNELPPYYLLYFLLVDLLGFKNLGQFEKVAWSVPLDYRGRAFLIEHRKLGLGLFSSDSANDQNAAREIADLLHQGVKNAESYFDWRAQEAVRESKLNVINRSGELFERFHYFADRYESVSDEADRRADETIKTKLSETSWSVSRPSYALWREAKWLALSAIDSFFSWTEHVFILLAILQGTLSTGDGVAKLALANWNAKYRAALDLADPDNKKFYDELITIRQQLRNFVAHGAFGKDGEAFLFHSNCGTVPVRLPHKMDARSFRFGHGIEFIERDALKLLDQFVQHLWRGARAPAKLYIQEHGMPLILTMVESGEYRDARTSLEAMTEFSDYLAGQMDRYANMDF